MLPLWPLWSLSRAQWSTSVPVGNLCPNALIWPLFHLFKTFFSLIKLIKTGKWNSVASFLRLISTLFWLISYYFHFWDSKYLKVKGNKRETLMQVSAPWATCHLIRSFTFWTSWERYTTDLLYLGLAVSSQRNTVIPSHYVVRRWFVFVSPFCRLVTL